MSYNMNTCVHVYFSCENVSIFYKNDILFQLYSNMKSIHDITQEELKLGIQGSASWHHQYRKSAYVFLG